MWVEMNNDIGPVFRARFCSECPDCGFDIEEGHEARMVEGVAWHKSCADLAERGEMG